MIFGAFASILAAILWAASFGIYRRFGEDISSFTLNLLKNSIALFFFFIAICVTRPEAPLNSACWIYLALSGFIGIALGDTALFESLKFLGARFTIFIGYGFLGEDLTLFESLGILITLVSVAGVLYFDRHDENEENPLKKNFVTKGIVFGLISAVLNGVGVALARKGFSGTDALLGSGIRMAPALIGLLVISTLQGKTQKSLTEIINVKHLPLLSVTAFFGGFVGILLASVGTIYLKAGLAATLTSSVPVWTFLIDRFFYSKRTRPVAIPFVFTTLIGLYFIFY